MNRIAQLLIVCLGACLYASGQYCDPYYMDCTGGGTGVPTTSYGTGTSNFAQQHFVPHMVSGGGFVTSVTLVNLNAVTNTGQLLYWGQDGSTQQRTPFSLAPGASMRVATPEAARWGPTTVQWLTVSSNLNLGVNTFFELQSSASSTTVVNTVGFNDPVETTSFVIPVEFQTTGGLRTVGLALANDTSDPTTVHLSLVNSSGATLASTVRSLASFQQISLDLFTVAEFQAVLPATNFLGTVVVTSDHTVSAIALGDDIGPFYSTPPILNGNVGQLVVPHMVSGGGFVTKLTFINMSTNTNALDVKLYDTAGNLLKDQTVTLPPNGTARISTDEAARFGPTQVSWADVSAPFPAAVNAFFELEDSVTHAVINTIGFNDAAAGTDFTFPVEFMPPSNSGSGRTAGLAIANPSASQTTVTLKLLDPSANVLATASVTLPPNGQKSIDLSNLAEFKAALPAGDFVGVVTLSSGTPVAVIALGDDFGPFYSTPGMTGRAF